MRALKSIVVGVDFSDCSLAAVHQAGRLAAWSDASITCITVIEPIIYDMSVPVMVVPIPTPTDQTEDARVRWTNFAPDAPGRGGMRFTSALGHPTGEIVHAAKENAADLVIVGTHSLFDAKRSLGAIAGGVARNAPCSVLLVRQNHRGPFKSIVVAVDFSESSRSALEQGVRFAQQDGSTLRVLHVYKDPWASARSDPDTAGVMPDFKAQYREAVVRKLETFAPSLAHELGASKATFHAEQDDSHAHGIIKFANHVSADLIIMGSRGHSRLRELVFGSTVEKAVREALCSTMVVR